MSLSLFTSYMYAYSLNEAILIFACALS